MITKSTKLKGIFLKRISLKVRFLKIISVKNTSLSFFVLTFCLSVFAQENQRILPISITLANDSAKEKVKEQQIWRLVASHNLKPWWFTNEIVIDENARIPFSHPKLTLTTFSPNNDSFGLSQLLHEQIHWFEESKKAEFVQIVEILKQHYPNAPVGFPDGARDEFSTYLHLAVCLLELDALARIIGKKDAESVIATNSRYFYTWIYKTVLQDQKKIRAILMDSDLLI